MHTRAPTASEHFATSEGVDGSGVPLSSLGTHIPVPPTGPLHQSLVGQSASSWHPVMQSPVVVSQVMPVWPAQSASTAHRPHSPAIDPVRKQNGSAVVSHGALPVP